MKNTLLLPFLFVFSVHFSQDTKIEPVFEQFEDQIKIRDFTINSDINEAYYTLQSMNEEVSVIIKVTKEENKWEEREIVEFSGKYKDLEPFLSPDGLRLYFVSNRPVASSKEKSKDFDIWYVERSGLKEKWSEPLNLGTPVNTEADEFYPAVSDSGNLYFTRPNEPKETKDDIFFSQFKNGVYSTPKALSDSINSEGYEFNSYIAPDESFLVFSGYNREDGLGSGDLYISYRNQKGDWTMAKNLNSINSEQMDYCPFIDLSKNELYFTSRRALNFSNENFDNIDELLKKVNSYTNGLSRIYKTDFSVYLNPGN